VGPRLWRRAVSPAISGCRRAFSGRYPPGRQRPDTLGTRGSRARWTGEAGDAIGAREQFAALLQTYERAFDPDHWKTLNVRTRHACRLSLMALVWGDQPQAGDARRRRARVSGPGAGLPCLWAAFFLARASPYAVVLPGVQRERQALPPDRAAGADRLRLRDLIKRGARPRDREEQFRVSMPACGQQPPVPAGGGDHLFARRPG
jgi:hypothetical protein